MNHIAILILIFAALLPGPINAETDDKVPIELIELQHRSADELMPHIRPLLSPRDALTGTGYRLIVRTSPGRLRQIRELVAELDRPPRELRLWVRTDEAGQGRQRTLDPAGETGESRVVRRHTTRAGENAQWVRVLDGQQAHIREGQIIPLAGSAVVHPDGTLAGGVDYRHLDRGFMVTPVLMPDGRVRLHIVQIAERESPAGGGRLETQTLQTVVTVEPGEWVELGGTVGRARQSDQRIVGTRRTQDRDEVVISVKIEMD